MAVDILELAEFYAGSDGARARAQIVQKIHALWPDPQAEPVLGYGYVVPYAEALWPRANWHLCMPAQQGVLVEDRPGGVRSALVDESLMPLRDGAFGRVITIHGLEAANHANALLGEIWRILVPNGRAIFVVPNRTGMWARRDVTPFGHGRPYSLTQLERHLREHSLEPIGHTAALYGPPSQKRFWLKMAGMAERTGRKLDAQRLAGANIVEVAKTAYAAPRGGAAVSAKTPLEVLGGVVAPKPKPVTGRAGRDQLG